jgi:hypothetical protein
MPRKPIDYSKGLIYKIVCNDITITSIYVGSTTDFTIRKYHHRYCCLHKEHRLNHLKIYQTINDNGGWDNWSMIEIEKYSCKDKRELEAREHYWFELLNSDLNIVPPFKTEDEKKEYRKLWREEDKKNNPEKYIQKDQEQREKRKEQRKIEWALWYEKNKDIVNEKKRLKRKQI